jgi:hypothetical protein
MKAEDACGLVAWNFAAAAAAAVVVVVVVVVVAKAEVVVVVAEPEGSFVAVSLQASFPAQDQP